MGLPAHLCGRGGPPTGLPCGSQIPTYSSFGVRSLRDLVHHVTACSEGARACWGGGCARPAFGPAPFLLGGVGAVNGLLPCFLVPKGNQPTACTLALWWLKFGPTKYGGRGGGEILEEAGTFSGQALLLSYPYPRGGGVQSRSACTHSPPCPQYLPNIPDAMHQVVKGSPLLAEDVYVTHSLSLEL